MRELKIWRGLSIGFAMLGVVQLPWISSRFGGIFFLLLSAACACEWLLLQRRDKHPLCRITSRIGQVLFALFVFCYGIVQVVVIGVSYSPNPQTEQASYLLVLGARVLPNGQPTASLAARCDTAADFLRQHPQAKAILCGGQGSNEPHSEAYAMAQYLQNKGIDRSRLLLEDRSSTTIENIAHAKSILTQQHGQDFPICAVVTNDYHLSRARRLLLHAGLGDLGLAAPTPQPAQWLSARTREFCSIMGLMLTGRW